LGYGIPGLTTDEISLSAGPLSGLAFIDDVVMQRRIVEEWLKRKMPVIGKHLAPLNGYNHDKVRVGYLSSDYCRHPITYLITELFEKHDRSKFEVYGYCSTKEDNSDVRKRILSSFDKLSLVLDWSDEQIANKIREDEIDILVDLNGMTKGTRLGALRYRPAPVQMTYLGYIGPIPFEELDYMICDHFTVPDKVAGEYLPKPLFMPDCYQVNDGKLGIGSPKTRAELGLPDDKFVLCSFSNSYKVTEPIFNSWMEIMNKCPNTVMWLLDDNPHARKNTGEWAKSRGIDADRIIYAGRVSPEDYLSRMRNADLFLDTYPYNSGTTASDALRMGLPLLTLSGECFSSRMAGSLLTAVGLPELISTDIETYVSKALDLINNPTKYRELRTRLEDGAWARGLGDTSRFTSQLETEYLKVVKKP
jgi:predicted O-linked N-acetylglucosamine transferase (SPINDLY family)